MQEAAMRYRWMSPLPAAALLALTITTPLEAREPYRAAALGPLSTVTEAMASGSRSGRALP